VNGSSQLLANNTLKRDRLVSADADKHHNRRDLSVAIWKASKVALGLRSAAHKMSAAV
jgi:hypothetical protein